MFRKKFILPSLREIMDCVIAPRAADLPAYGYAPHPGRGDLPEAVEHRRRPDAEPVFRHDIAPQPHPSPMRRKSSREPRARVG